MKQLSFAVRRRFAKTAFISLLLTLFSVLGVAFFGGPEVADNLREAGIIIAPIIVCLTALVAQYSYLVYKTDTKNMKLLSRLKLYGAALLAFFLTLLSAKYWKGKAKQNEKNLKKEKAKVHNIQAQVKAAKRAQERHQKEIDNAIKDGSYIDYFDES